MAQPKRTGGAVAPRGPDLQDRGRGLPRRQRKPRKPKQATFRPPSYGAKQAVKGGVKKRAQRRLKALGGVEGVSPKDGLTGREARKIKRSWLREGRPGAGGGGKSRRGNAPRRPPVDPYRQEVNALTRLQFGGQRQELDYERRLSEQHQANLGGWYQNYQNTVQQAAAQQAAYTQGLQAAQFQQANQAAGTDQAQNQQLLAQQQQQAAQRGMTVDPSLAQNMQAGVAARQAQGTAFGGLIGAQGNAQTGYLQNRVGIAAGEGIQAQQDEQRKRMQIEKLAMDLKKDIGAFKVKARSDIQGREHTQRLENAAFGLDVAKEQADQEEARRDDRRQARADRATRRDRRIDNRRQAARDRLLNANTRADIKKKKGQAALDRTADLADDGRRNYSTDYSEWAQRTRPDKDGGGSGAGKDGKYTQSQINSAQKDFRRVRAVNLKGIPRKDWVSYVSDQYEIDPLLVRGALMPGSLSPRQRRELARMGIRPKKPKGKTYGGPGTGLPRGTVG